MTELRFSLGMSVPTSLALSMETVSLAETFTAFSLDQS